VDAEQTHGLGYERVDDDPNVSVLLGTMDATGEWEATRRLRAWERRHLRLRAGERLLDVGCGLGDAARVLAADLGETGEVRGVDASHEMVVTAQSRARDARCSIRFSVGDAEALDEPAGRYDVVRSERTLQWLRRPEVAVAEMTRTLVAGGRLSLIDTDWSTFRLDVGDSRLAARVAEAMRTERRRASNVGRELTALALAAGCTVVADTTATQTWEKWNPDVSPAPDGCFSMSSLADDLIDVGQLSPAERDDFISTVHSAARNGSFSMELTMFAVVATTPVVRPPTARA